MGDVSETLQLLAVVCFVICFSGQLTLAEDNSTEFKTDQQVRSESPDNNTSKYAESLFAPYDPDRHYVHVRYFEVGKLDFEHVRLPFVISCWILIAGLGKMAFHMMPRVSVVVPESCLLIVIGILVGAVLNACLGDIEAAHHLDPDMFFLFLLPPIILDAGYFMPNRLFFDNLGTIILMAVAGTIFNAFAIGGAIYCMGLTGIYSAKVKLLDIFLFSTLISAVDPVAVLAVFEEIQVNDVLYIVVFGESLLNDAVTVGLYHMFEEYIETGIENLHLADVGKGFVKFTSAALGGTLMGLIFGLITAFFTRFTHRARVMEPLLVFIMSYLAYLGAEVFHFSGILSMTFCGLMMKNYVITNVSVKSNTTIKYMTKMLSSSSETAIFMLLGVATVHNNHIWNFGFIVVTLLSCVIFRFIGVIVLTWLANKVRLHPISASDAFIIGYGGLRGAVAFALVLLIDPHYVPEQQMFLSTTIVVVYFTVFLQGITIKPLVNHLGIKRSNERNLTMNERLHERALDHVTAGVEDLIGHPFSYNFRHKFKQFDRKFFIPFLTRNASNRLKDPKILETYISLMVQETFQDIAKKLGKPVDTLQWRMSGSFQDLIPTTGWSMDCDLQEIPSHHRLTYSRQAISESQLSSPCLKRKHQWEAGQGKLARSLVNASQRSSAPKKRTLRQYRSLPLSDSCCKNVTATDQHANTQEQRTTTETSTKQTSTEDSNRDQNPERPVTFHIVNIHPVNGSSDNNTQQNNIVSNSPEKLDKCEMYKNAETYL